MIRTFLSVFIPLWFISFLYGMEGNDSPFQPISPGVATLKALCQDNVFKNKAQVQNLLVHGNPEGKGDTFADRFATYKEEKIFFSALAHVLSTGYYPATGYYPDHFFTLKAPERILEKGSKEYNVFIHQVILSVAHLEIYKLGNPSYHQRSFQILQNIIEVCGNQRDINVDAVYKSLTQRRSFQKVFKKVKLLTGHDKLPPALRPITGEDTIEKIVLWGKKPLVQLITKENSQDYSCEDLANFQAIFLNLSKHSPYFSHLKNLMITVSESMKDGIPKAFKLCNRGFYGPYTKNGDPERYILAQTLALFPSQDWKKLVSLMEKFPIDSLLQLESQDLLPKNVTEIERLLTLASQSFEDKHVGNYKEAQDKKFVLFFLRTQPQEEQEKWSHRLRQLRCYEKREVIAPFLKDGLRPTYQKEQHPLEDLDLFIMHCEELDRAMTPRDPYLDADVFDCFHNLTPEDRGAFISFLRIHDRHRTATETNVIELMQTPREAWETSWPNIRLAAGNEHGNTNNQTIHDAETEQKIQLTLQKLQIRYQSKANFSDPVAYILRIAKDLYTGKRLTEQEYKFLNFSFSPSGCVPHIHNYQARLNLVIHALDDAEAHQELLNTIDPEKRKMLKDDTYREDNWVTWLRNAPLDLQRSYLLDRNIPGIPPENTWDTQDGGQSCIPGASNRLITALSLIHPDVPDLSGEKTEENVRHWKKKAWEEKWSKYAQETLPKNIKTYLLDLKKQNPNVPLQFNIDKLREMIKTSLSSIKILEDFFKTHNEKEKDLDSQLVNEAERFLLTSRNYYLDDELEGMVEDVNQPA